MRIEQKFSALRTDPLVQLPHELSELLKDEQPERPHRVVAVRTEAYRVCYFQGQTIARPWLGVPLI